MGDDLRKYAPRISTILRETDPAKMEERHRRALADPALKAAVEAMRSGLESPPPGEAAAGPRDTPVADVRPVTKATSTAPVPQRSGARRKVLVGLAAVAAVAVPTTLGIVLATRAAGRGSAPSASATPAVSVVVAPSAPAASVAAPVASVAPSATAAPVASVAPSATAAPTVTTSAGAGRPPTPGIASATRRGPPVRVTPAIDPGRPNRPPDE
jgi:hypothetical protein